MDYRILLVATSLLATTPHSHAAELFPFGSPWKFLLGTREASNPVDAWTGIAFNDANWTNNAATPIGFGEKDIVTRLPAPGRNRFWIATFFRKTFVIDKPANVAELKINVRVDDGCAVWVNGRSVGRYNVPDGDLSIYTPFFTPLPLGEIEPTVATFSVTESLRTLLVPGTNVVAVEVYNANFESSDFLFDAAMEFTMDEQPPQMIDRLPPPGVALPTLTQFEVLFNEDVSGVDAADLLINGTPALGVDRVTDSQYVFDFPSPPTGPVEMRWRADHGIVDMADPPNPFQGGTWNYTIDPTAPLPGVVISEFLADNDKGIHDEDGDDSDWVELYNSGFTSTDLSGWSLTTKTNDLAQWRFPAITLLPRHYLVIFASGKDRTNAAAPLHTNFKLSKEGGYLALTDATGKVVSEFAPAYPSQRTDVSYGRDRANPDTVGFFPTPTPGAPNSIQGAGFGPEVQFSLSGRAFTTPFTLALSTASSNALIRYTLGTNLPTELSAIYTNPIPISATTQVRARAFQPGVLPGPVRSEIYLQLSGEVAGFNSDLPIVLLHNFGRGSVPSSVDQFVTMQVFEPKQGTASLLRTPDLSGTGVIHKRGRSTSGLAKASFFVEVQGEYGEDRNAPFAGLPSESDWVLYAPNSFDTVLIHNPVAHELMRQMGRYSPRTRFVEVYLQDSSGSPGAFTPAEYNGVYVLEEKIKIGANRVDIDKLQPEHTNSPAVTGGYLLSIDNSPPDSIPFYGAGTAVNYLDPSYSEVSTPQRRAQQFYINAFFNAFDEALHGTNWTDPNLGYAAYIDVPAAIDHHLQGVLTFNVDALRLSGYFYKPRDGKLTMGPVWDFDRTQGSTDGRDFNPRVWRSTVPDFGTDMFNSDPIFENPWYSRMFRDLDFWQKWIDRYQELRRDVLSTTNVQGVIDAIADQVRQAQPREVARWRGSSGSDTTPRNGRRSSGGYTYTFPGTYQGEVEFMKIWYSNRLDFLDGQFLNPPQLDRPAGTVAPGASFSLSAPEGATIYYTLDGSDPRLPGGAVSPAAKTYNAPIVVNDNVRVVARAQDLNHKNLTGSGKPPLSSTWSGPAAATFAVTTPPLVITEIMYDPLPSASGAGDAASYEFVEVRNIGTNTLNLAGFRFTRGISFVFPAGTLAPGARTVVVANLAAFRARYGEAVPVAGVYTGQLDNDGERLTLEGPLQEPILDFSYDDQWYPITQGLGFSLVTVDDTASLDTWGNPASWHPSVAVNGSPGAADAATPLFPPVVVNEVLSHPQPPLLDAIELLNTGATPAEIGGWYLSDDFDSPFKFRIPNNTVIPPGGFQVFSESEFGADPQTGFGLGAGGDDVYLFSADPAGHLTGYVHGFDFDAADPGVTFGRYVSSTGEDHFVAQLTPTLGATNSGPRIGPVVINEIMFEPSPLAGGTNNVRDEFIELRNVSSQSVSLGAPPSATNTWRLHGGVDFYFPHGTTLPPGGYLLITGFDPVLDTNQWSAFRNQYPLPTNVAVVGPWSGQLQNSGERLRLSKPSADLIDTNSGAAQEIVVDEVNYRPAAPWPSQASGTGESLQRITSNAFGDDAVNWLAALPSPGQPTASPSQDSDHDGLPDDWEIASGLDPNDATGTNGPAADPDGDGFTNLQEYLSGTDPRSASSYLQVGSVEFTPSGLTLHVLAAAGRSYSVLVQSELGTGTWSKFVDIPAVNTTRDVGIIVADPVGPAFPQRFFRIVTPALP